MKKLDISFEFLDEEYTNKKKSMNVVAKEIGTTAMTIYNRLKEYSIPRRTPLEAHPWRGKKRPEHSKLMKGRKNPGVSIANRNRTGKDALNFIDGRFLDKHYCSICGKQICYKTWKDGNSHCKSCSNRLNMLGKIAWNKNLTAKIDNRILVGKNSGMFGKVIKPNWIEYNGQKFRSSWEVIYAKELDSKKIKWLYEPKTFDLGNTTYTPDFYLAKTKEYIEVKGYKSEVFENKYKLFKKLYSKIKIKILDETYFRRKDKR